MHCCRPAPSQVRSSTNIISSSEARTIIYGHGWWHLYPSRYHMKRCVDSGLWCPNKEDPGTSAEDGFTVTSRAEEEVYEEVK